MRIESYRTEINHKLHQHANSRAIYKEERKKHTEAIENLAILEEAQLIIQHVAQEVQENAHSKIADVVSKCLQSIFDDPYEFKIHFEQKRGKTEARLVFYRDGEEVDPIDASGGGTVDVAAFALRVASIIMSKPKLRRTIVSDEPFRFVSEKYWERVREMIETLSEEMGIQIIQVTHNNELKTGRLFHIGEK